MINKRNGFKTRYIQNNKPSIEPFANRSMYNDQSLVNPGYETFISPSKLARRNNPYLSSASSYLNSHLREGFDLNNVTLSVHVYAIVDETGKFAMTSDGNKSEQIIMKPFDPKDENQWMLVDSDINIIKFFSSWKSYFSIEVYETSKEDILAVKHSDTIQNGTFDFTDGQIKVHNYPSYGLAFKKEKLDYENTKSAQDYENTNYSDSKVQKESFMTRAARWLVETFDETKDTPLECVNLKKIDTSKYSTKWKFVDLYDLRDLTDCARENELLLQANNQGDSAIDNYKKQLETEQSRRKTETDELNAIIKEYEKSWYVRTFLKSSSNGNTNTDDDDTE